MSMNGYANLLEVSVMLVVLNKKKTKRKNRAGAKKLGGFIIYHLDSQRFVLASLYDS